MHAVVCLKQIIDPDIPPRLFEIDPIKKTQIRGSQSLVISPFDEIALEVALQLKEQTAGSVTAVTIAGQNGLQALHQALAMGADEAVLLDDPAFEDEGAHEVAGANSKATILAAALAKLAPFDLVLCGRQAGDVELGLVGPFLAEVLHIPCITLVANVEENNGRYLFKRPLEAGYEVLEAPLPLLITVTNDESNVPRYPSVLGIRKAMRREIPVWNAADLGLEPETIFPKNGRMEMVELFIPQRQSQCELIEGESSEEKARTLALRLRELKLI